MQYEEGDRQDESLDIRVTLPRGGEIVLNTRRGNGGAFKPGTVVDVDWKEIR